MTLLEKLSEPKVFDTFIQENMKTSTFKSVSKPEMDIEYEPGKAYSAYVAEYKAAMAGSIVDKNGKKPIHDLPTADQLTGTIARIADKWQMDNEKLDHYFYLEQRYQSRVKDYTDEQKIAEYKKLVKYLFNPYEIAVIAPWKRTDISYFEGLFNGYQDVTLDNNSKSGVRYQFDLGIKKFAAKVAAWGESNATPVEDIQQVVDYAESKGKNILRVRMSRSTFFKMCKASQFQSQFTLKLGKSNILPASLVPVEAVNEYLESVQLPKIEIETPKPVLLPNGSSINLIPNDRVVFMFAEKVAVLKVAESVEKIDKLPNKVYSTYDENLVGALRTEEGRFIDYEMWATPVFVGKEDYAILKTDVTSL